MFLENEYYVYTGIFNQITTCSIRAAKYKIEIFMLLFQLDTDILYKMLLKRYK